MEITPSPCYLSSCALFCWCQLRSSPRLSVSIQASLFCFTLHMFDFCFTSHMVRLHRFRFIFFDPQRETKQNGILLLAFAKQTNRLFCLFSLQSEKILKKNQRSLVDIQALRLRPCNVSEKRCILLPPVLCRSRKSGQLSETVIFFKYYYS